MVHNDDNDPHHYETDDRLTLSRVDCFSGTLCRDEKESHHEHLLCFLFIQKGEIMMSRKTTVWLVLWIVRIISRSDSFFPPVDPSSQIPVGDELILV